MDGDALKKDLARVRDGLAALEFGLRADFGAGQSGTM
jgi:hypothetical protein